MGFPFLSRQGHKTSQTEHCPSKMKSVHAFSCLSQRWLMPPLYCLNPVHTMGRGLHRVRMAAGGETRNPSIQVPISTGSPISKTVSSVGFPLPNLTSSCVGPSTETGNRQENPTLIQQTPDGSSGQFKKCKPPMGPVLVTSQFCEVPSGSLLQFSTSSRGRKLNHFEPHWAF